MTTTPVHLTARSSCAVLLPTPPPPPPPPGHPWGVGCPCGTGWRRQQPSAGGDLSTAPEEPLSGSAAEQLEKESACNKGLNSTQLGVQIWQCKKSGFVVWHVQVLCPALYLTIYLFPSPPLPSPPPSPPPGALLWARMAAQISGPSVDCKDRFPFLHW